jgi:hypothetical protein
MNFPQEEERILARWKEIDAFLRQVELVSGCAFRFESCKQALLCRGHVMLTPRSPELIEALRSRLELVWELPPPINNADRL